MELDKLDRRILLELDKNSRQTTSDIARTIKQGRDRVEYRIERLQAEGILRTCTTSVNLHKLGFTIFKTYLRLENNKQRVPEFIRFLREHPRVYWIALADGSWDLMIAIFAKNPQEFYEIHNKILSAFNDIVLNFAMHTLVQIQVYRKYYLTGSGKEYSLVGGPPQENPIDATDYAILKLLSKDSRTPVTDIAKEIRSTPAIVKYRIERMEKAQIITGYRIEVDLRKLGMLFFKTQLFLRSYDEQTQKKFQQYCASNPHITFYIEQLGECTIELEIEVNDYEQYHNIIEEIRQQFSRLIRNFQTVLIRKSYFNWVPQDLVIESPQS